ncbi:MAG: outer membrane beta-barrel protein [Ferruginibacter sp.]|nr:outer membrane beta-barrel protein [Ferruginibacter sp.]
MLDEEMDHIIREAAESHHPPYNDKAWEKMEQKLDKHLPQKKDNRRYIFFLLFFLLLGGGLFFFVNNRSANNNTFTSNKIEKSKNPDNTDKVVNGPVLKQEISESKLPVTIPTDRNAGNETVKTTETNKNKLVQQTEPEKSSDNAATALTNENNTGVNARVKNKPGKEKSRYDLVNAFPNAGSKKNKPGSNNKNAGVDEYKTANSNVLSTTFEETQAGEALVKTKKPISGKTGSKLKVNITSPEAEGGDISTSSAIIAGTDKKSEETSDKINKEAATDPEKSEADKKLTATAKKDDKKKPQNKFAGNFGLTFSVGPDMSFVKLSRTGKTTITYGAGLSYDFAKRLTARAGFYVSRKKYEASPDEYHNTIYPNLTSIDANCKVFEIPVSLTYNFARRKKHNWFGNVGISSFIMKSEDYVYNYKTAAGQTYTYDRSISNENKHLFSVLNISAGYKYQLSQKISLQAEPYVQIPLGGVGYGKIKLNSAGVLFTATYKPFKKKK